MSAVDIFGRHTAMSPPSAWFQWAWPVGSPDKPPPPKPWYYVEPPADRQINAFAVQLLDKSPPPRPPAVEVYALDPADPMLLRDDTYTAWWLDVESQWWNQPGVDRDSVLPLRVRWEWTSTQMLQAPDTKEFRIYFNPGTAPPADDAANPANWQDRIYVVGYNQHVTVIKEGGTKVRRYDVLLPIVGDPQFDGAPLAPSEADPIVYAHGGVSAADDKMHTADDPKWASGNWGDRIGNEGRVGAPAKIYRVLRAKPPPPGVVDESDKVFATRADYHSRSYYTFRWPKRANVEAHVFRALDDTLFQIDLAHRPRGTLDTTDPAIFPIA